MTLNFPKRSPRENYAVSMHWQGRFRKPIMDRHDALHAFVAALSEERDAAASCLAYSDASNSNDSVRPPTTSADMPPTSGQIAHTQDVGEDIWSNTEFLQDARGTAWSLQMTGASVLDQERATLGEEMGEHAAPTVTGDTLSTWHAEQMPWDPFGEAKDLRIGDLSLSTPRPSSRPTDSAVRFALDVSDPDVLPRALDQARIDSWSTINESNGGERSPSIESTNPQSHSSWVSVDGTTDMDILAGENLKLFPPRNVDDPRPVGIEHRMMTTLSVRDWISKHSTPAHEQQSDRREGLEEAYDSEDDDHGLDAASTTSQGSGTAVSELDRQAQDLWGNVISHQARIRQLSKKLEKASKRLGKLRSKLRLADNEFINGLRTGSSQDQFLSPATTMHLVWTKLPELQRLRDMTADLEHSDTELRWQLAKEASSLFRAEVQLYSLLGYNMDESSATSTYESSEASYNVGDADTDLLGVPITRSFDDYHPLFENLVYAARRYLHTMSELQEVEANRALLQDTVDRRTALGAHVPQETNDNLAEVVSEEARYLEFAHSEMKVIDDLKQQSIARDVVSARISRQTASVLHPDDDKTALPITDGDMQRPTRRKIAIPDLFKLLLPAYRYPEPAPTSGGQDIRPSLQTQPERHGQLTYSQVLSGLSCSLNRARDDTAKFINEWLLDQLRSSRRTVDQLFVAFTSRRIVRNAERWQHDVLRNWHRDGTDQIMKGAEAGLCSSAYYISGNESVQIPSRRASYAGRTSPVLEPERKLKAGRTLSSRASRRSRVQSAGF